MIDRLEFQRGGQDHPLDDVVVRGTTPQGEDRYLEVQAKRSMAFTESDANFSSIVDGMVRARKIDPDRRFAVAIECTTGAIDNGVQEVLELAQQMVDVASFLKLLGTPGRSNKDMRAFVATFRVHLETSGETGDDALCETLRSISVLTFDYARPNSIAEQHDRFRARQLTVSKGLGKRTVRFKTESRTIELMGLHRRTRVEQLRERDLMMPQEVRQMPTSKMVIMAEGQNPIYADKLQFFRTAPFRALEWFSRANPPDVPATEFLPQRRMPATSPSYVHGSAEALKSEEQGAQSEERAKRHDREPSPGSKPEAVGRPGQSVAASAAKTSPPAGVSARAVPDMLDARFAKAARKLKTLAMAPAGAGSRNGNATSWARVFDETVPDELEIAEAEAG